MTGTNPKVCGCCKGRGSVDVKLKDLGGHQRDGCGVIHIIGCPDCNGKKYLNDEDREALRQCVRGPEVYNGIMG